MRAKFKHVVLMLACVLMVGIMTGCKDDNGLSGAYANIGSDELGEVYYFVNNNTVERYWCCKDGSGTVYDVYYGERLGKTQLYYSKQYTDIQTYTYTRDGNKVIIPMKGKIFTISGNNLIEDGGSTYRKY